MKLLLEEQLKLQKLGYYLESGIDRTDKSQEDIKKLGNDHRFHVEAAKRYQEFFAIAIDELCFAYHNGRSLIPDGDWGPASTQQLSLPRCGFPDVLTASEKEQANWPTSCRMNLTTSYQPGMTLPGLNTQQIHEMFERALLNVMEDFEIGITVEDNYPNTNIAVVAARLGGSILADQYLAVNSCNFTSRGRMDNDRNWEFWYAVTVRSHEDGHAWGMGHVGDPSALLYPSINSASVSRKGKMNGTDKALMRNIGYKDRTSPIPGPDPTPNPPGPTGDRITGDVFVGENRYKIFGIRF